MLVERMIGGLRFRIAKGEYRGHGQGVKSGRSVVFGAFRIGTKIFSHLDVPLDLLPEFEMGREVEIFTTVIGSKQSLVAVTVDGDRKVSMNYRDIDQENVATVMLAGVIGMGCGLLGVYASASGSGVSLVGLIVSSIVLLPSSAATLVSIWYSSVTTDIQRAANELAA